MMKTELSERDKGYMSWGVDGGDLSSRNTSETLILRFNLSHALKTQNKTCPRIHHITNKQIGEVGRVWLQHDRSDRPHWAKTQSPSGPWLVTPNPTLPLVLFWWKGDRGFQTLISRAGQAKTKQSLKWKWRYFLLHPRLGQLPLIGC